MKKFISLLLTVMVLMSCVISVSAAGSKVTLKTSEISVSADNKHTSTDLFSNFEGVMPGDTLTQQIEIKNDVKGYDYVKVYLKAVPHNDSNQPVKKDLTSEESNEFLSQLRMTVTDKKGNVIYGETSPDKNEKLTSRKYLATVNRGKSTSVKVSLVVPLSLSTDFKNAAGEVDWVFTYEGYNNPSNGNFKTGDIIMICVIVMILALAALVVLFFLKKRKKK